MSTEPETVMAESDRIIVMSKGRITAEFVGQQVTQGSATEFTHKCRRSVRPNLST